MGEYGDNQRPDSSSGNHSQRHLSTASWAFLGIFVVSMMALILFGPAELPEYRHRAFAILCAILAAFAAWFLIGDLSLESSEIKTGIGKFKLKATGGIGVFIFVLAWWHTPFAPIAQKTSDISVTDQTKPNYPAHTPEIVAKELGIPVPLAKKFLALMRDAYVKEEVLDTELRVISARYKKIQEKLAQLKSKDPEVKTLLDQAVKALQSAEFQKAELRLDKAITLDKVAARALEQGANERRLSAADTAAAIAEIHANNFELNKAAHRYKSAIELSRAGADLVRVAKYQMRLALVNLNLRKSGQSFKLLSSSLAICASNPCGTRLVVRLYLSRGDAWLNHGENSLQSTSPASDERNVQNAIDSLKQALAYKNFFEIGDRLLVAQIWRRMASAYMRIDKAREALLYINKALSAHIDNKGDKRELPILWITKAEVLEQIKPEDPKIEALYRKATKREIDLFGENHPRAAFALLGLGSYLVDMKKANEALKYLRKARSIRSNIYGVNHLRVADTWVEIGKAWVLKKEYETAVRKFDMALGIYNVELKENSRVIAMVELEKADALAHSQRWARASISYQRGHDIFKERNGEDYPNLAGIKVKLSKVMTSMKDYKRAIYWLSSALDSYTQIDSQDVGLMANLRFRLGKLFFLDEQRQKAIAQYELALKGFREKFNKDTKEVASVLDALGDAWVAEKDLGKAVSYLQRSWDLRKKLYGPNSSETRKTGEKLKQVQARM